MIIQSHIEKKISEYFKPDYMQVINESFMHQVPKDAESHFKVVIVSSLFMHKSLLNRHRMVQKLLQDDMKKIHALSLVTKTPTEWKDENMAINKSPECMHK